MKKNKNHIQQGDVLVSLVSELPAGCRRIKRDARGVVLAEGEHTGHFHGSQDGGLALMEAPDGRKFLVNEGEKEATVTHQEHKPIVIPAGSVAELGIVREYDWFSRMVRPVMD